MKHFLIISILCIQSVCSAQTKYSKDVEEKIREVEHSVSLHKFQIEGKPNATLEERMAYYHVKGLSIAVIHDYKIEWAKGYGWADSAEQRKVTTETVFQPGSISKSLNALGVLKLVQNKKIDLDTDINTYLSSWKFPYDSISKDKKITVSNLLSHTAGLGVHGFPGYYKGDTFPSIPEILDGKKPANTAAVRSLFEPGLKFSYSGGGTMISQLITMDITKMPYDAYIQKAVFQPIGMNNSSFTQPPLENKRNLLATGYGADGKEIPGKYPILLEQAAGGLWTTPTDLCKFILEMQLSLKGKSNKVLSPEMTNKMLSPFVEGVGFGVFIENVNGTKYFHHSAGNQGFSGQYYGSFEDGNGLAVVINSDNGGDLVQEVITAVATAYQWKGFYNGEKPVTQKVIDVPDSMLQKYVGIYRQNTMITMIEKKGHELFYFAGPIPWKMHFISPTEFFNLESVSMKTMQQDHAGNITGIARKVNDKDAGSAERINLIDLPDSTMDRYAGSYMDGESPLALVKKDKALWVDFGYGQPLGKLFFITTNEFFIREDFGAIYSFKINADRQVEAIIGKANNNEKIIKRVR